MSTAHGEAQKNTQQSLCRVLHSANGTRRTQCRQRFLCRVFSVMHSAKTSLCGVLKPTLGKKIEKYKKSRSPRTRLAAATRTPPHRHHHVRRHHHAAAATTSTLSHRIRPPATGIRPLPLGSDRRHARERELHCPPERAALPAVMRSEGEKSCRALAIERSEGEKRDTRK